MPGKIAKCVGSLTFLGVSVGATRGHMHEDAPRTVAGGCGGKWGVDERDIKRAVEYPTHRRRAPDEIAGPPSAMRGREAGPGSR